jgi:hypothetical protein
MFTIRNLGGVSLFLLGTTFMWVTPAFASKGVSTSGLLWSMTRVLAFATIAGFTIATWGLFQRASWWEPLAVGSALLGIATMVPYWIAAARAGETNPAFNVFIHVLGCAGVLALLLIPQLEQWVSGHVLGS